MSKNMFETAREEKEDIANRIEHETHTRRREIATVGHRYGGNSAPEYIDRLFGVTKSHISV